MVMGTGADKPPSPTSGKPQEGEPPDMSQRPSGVSQYQQSTPPDLISPSAQAAAADKVAYDLAEDIAKKKSEEYVEIVKRQQERTKPSEGDMVKYQGLALKVTHVYEDNPNVVDLETFNAVPIWDVKPLTPEPGWEEHKAEAAGGPRRKDAKDAKDAKEKGKTVDKDKDYDKDDKDKDKDDKSKDPKPSPYPSPGGPGTGKPNPYPSHG